MTDRAAAAYDVGIVTVRAVAPSAMNTSSPATGTLAVYRKPEASNFARAHVRFDDGVREGDTVHAADVLANAGLLPESDRMLTDELARSPAPYYFMLGLAANARARGDKALALDWYARAHDAARGPATRLQWGATHVRALIDLAPGDVRAVAVLGRTFLLGGARSDGAAGVLRVGDLGTGSIGRRVMLPAPE